MKVISTDFRGFAAFLRTGRILRLAFLCCAATILSPDEALGIGGGGGGSTTRTWVGEGTNDNWNTAENWDDGEGNAGAPVDGDSLVFVGENRPSNNNNLTGSDATWLVPEIVFANDGTTGRTDSFVLNGDIFDIGLGGGGTGTGIETLAVTTGPAIIDTIALDIELFSTGAVVFDTGLNHDLRITGRVIDDTSDESDLTKTGVGTLFLDGDNTYDGITTVSEGTLLINGDSSAANGTVTITSGATLGGSGTVGGDTTINGVHTPGNPAGAQAFTGDLTYDAGSSILWELFDNTTSGSGTNFDRIDVGGDLTFNSATTLTLDFSGGSVDWGDDFWNNRISEWQIWNVSNSIVFAGGLGLDDITLATAGLDSNGNAFNPGVNVPSSANFYLFQTGNGIYLRYEAIPEPTTFGLLGLMIGLLTIFARPRRKCL